MRLIVRILNKLRLLKYFNFTITTFVNKRPFRIPIIGTMGLTNFIISEPWMTKVLSKLTSANPDGAYLDIGVNIGQTLLKLKSVDTKIRYFGFEPNSNCIYYLKKLIQANSFQNVTLFPCGLSDTDFVYELNFYSDNDTDSSASMVENFRPERKIYKKEFIPCYKIDTVFSSRTFPLFSIIKIDIEGGELEVLQGLENLILKDKPYIQIEVLPVYDISNTQRLLRQNKIESLLKKWGYSIFRIYSTDNNEFESIKQIMDFEIHSNLNWCEYLLVPNSEVQKVQSLF